MNAISCGFSTYMIVEMIGARLIFPHMHLPIYRASPFLTENVGWHTLKLHIKCGSNVRKSEANPHFPNAGWDKYLE